MTVAYLLPNRKHILPDTAPDEQEIRKFLLDLFNKAIAAADPANCVPQHLPKPPTGDTLLIATGKAAASMAQAAERAWPKNTNLSGVALTRYGHTTPCECIDVIEASHPVPDDRGHKAAKDLLMKANQLGENDLLLFLVSGGGSSLLTLPAEGITLDDKKAINHALLMSGAPIGEMNCVRKHLSAIKGGRLAEAAYPAKVVTLAISDVPGDNPSTIASGPTVADPTTISDMVEIVQKKYALAPPSCDIKSILKQASETLKEGDRALMNNRFTLIATPSTMMQAVATHVRAAGHKIIDLGANIEGEARQVAVDHASLASRSDGPVLILSGGETTVTVNQETKPGKGGRNAEYLLALAISLDGAANIHAIAADTDGIDGSEDNAGAIITPDTLSRAKAIGLDPQSMLDNHDAYSFFEALGDLVITGPTLTNVNDFRAIWMS